MKVVDDVGVNRDESVAPGNQVLAEVERLRRENEEYREMLGPPGAEWSDPMWTRNQLAMTKDYVTELRRELAEANEAIRELTDAGDAMRFSMPTAAMAGKSAWDEARRHPAVPLAMLKEPRP